MIEVTRHIWQDYVEETDHLRHHKDVKPIYAKRKNDRTPIRRCKRKAWHALDKVKGT
ncbi:hypothetical protein BCI9360_01847 [Bacillus sp. CECT 9360]|nr:hypothetical protein BCI9360_01847 [Bacillus sp. CECT 9360]